MASSVYSIHTDSDGAGHGNGARTPTRQVHASTAAAAASELSPPGSQPTLTDPIPNLATFGGVEALKYSDSIQQGNGQPFDVPVAAWKGKRAQEEYQRAMDNVIDQNFNLSMSILLAFAWIVYYLLTRLFFPLSDR